jgi:hypothetical protein
MDGTLLLKRCYARSVSHCLGIAIPDIFRRDWILADFSHRIFQVLSIAYARRLHAMDQERAADRRRRAGDIDG